MTVGNLVKRFLADELGIEPGMQFYVYGVVLGIVVIISMILYPGIRPLY
jgi:hypothetical protein